MRPYEAEYPEGTIVRVATRDYLLRFARDWKLHNPLAKSQIEFAGAVAAIAEVGFYHGGDVVYRLEGLPGTWHQQCLSRA